MFFKRFAVCVFTLQILSLSVAAQTEYYPLTPGITYQYQVIAAEGDVPDTPRHKLLASVMHLTPDTVQGKKVIPERHLINGEQAGLSFVAEDETGVYYYATQSSDGKRRMVQPAQYLIKYPVSTGTTWLQRSSEFESLNDNKKLMVEMQATIESEDEIVIVPAGVYAKCLKISMVGATVGKWQNKPAEFKVEKQMWYAPGLGLIKLIQKETRMSDSVENGSFTLTLQLNKFHIAASRAENAER